MGTGYVFLILSTLVAVCRARIHHLSISEDTRKYIPLTTFGFLKGGILDVHLTNFGTDGSDDDIFGFSLDETRNDAMNPYLDTHLDYCVLDPQNRGKSLKSVIFTMDRKNLVLKINESAELQSLHIYRDQSELPVVRPKRGSLSDRQLFNLRSVKSSPVESNGQKPNISLIRDANGHLSTRFVVYIADEKEEGLYNLYFHSCPNYGETKVHVKFTIAIEEVNNGNYLSAGEMPLPALYFMMSILFFLSGCFWVFILCKSKHTVFKIHHLMAVLVYLKSFSLLFHAINYHFIESKGYHVPAWAILYYITHLLKGSVLFITIILIGTGWTFIKNLLSERDKKIFMFIIPLQVLNNIVNIIIEESEEGDVEHKTWSDVFMFIDLLCCGAIIFPVVWSIKYLQEAAHIDGKAAINLRKLKLFRQFYIMIVCYIYFTRIIVYLLEMTVSFQYEWLDEMFREMVTYVFFVLTGYKFRPASANPYFQLNTEEEDPEDIVLSQCGVTEGITKLSRMINDQTEEENDTLLVAKKESSHERRKP